MAQGLKDMNRGKEMLTFSKSTNLAVFTSKHPKFSFHSATRPILSHELTASLTSSLLMVKNGAP